MAEDNLETRRQQLKEYWQHMPKELEMILDKSFTPDGRNIVTIKFIHKWDDGFGNIVYTANTVGAGLTSDQVRSLSKSSFEKSSNMS